VLLLYADSTLADLKVENGEVFECRYLRATAASGSGGPAIEELLFGAADSGTAGSTSASASAPTDDSFQIWVQFSITNKIALRVQGSNTIDNLKGQLQAMKGYDPSTILLMFNNQLVDDHKTLNMWGIMPNAIIQCLTRQQYEVEEAALLGLS
jgi:hypothetical protein